jgi:hypothetical protein
MAKTQASMPPALGVTLGIAIYKVSSAVHLDDFSTCADEVLLTNE